MVKKKKKKRKITNVLLHFDWDGHQVTCSEWDTCTFAIADVRKGVHKLQKVVVLLFPHSDSSGKNNSIKYWMSQPVFVNDHLNQTEFFDIDAM